MTSTAQPTGGARSLSEAGATEASSRRGPTVYIVLAAVLVVLGLLGLWLAGEGTLVVQSAPAGAEVSVDGRVLGTTPYTFQTRLTSQSGDLELRLGGYQTERLPFQVEPRQQHSLSANLIPIGGSVEVHSTPDGSQVYLDGVGVGVTPLVLDTVLPAVHRIEVRREGFQASAQDVAVTAGQRASVRVQLVPASGVLSLTSVPEGAKVFVDGAERGATPVRLDSLAVGEHSLKVSLEGYQDWQQTAKIEAGEPVALRVELVAAPGAPGSDPVALDPPARPIAVMIDNHVEARPQAGLSSADIVYEAIAEGGVTRYLGIFASRPAEMIGPVRSARHYFVHWANEYDAMYVHCGGYPEAYAAIQATGIADFDDLRGSPGFWRSSARVAPHNLYTSTAALRQAAGALGFKSDLGSYGGLRFENAPSVAEGEPAGSLSISYPFGYNVVWDYSADSDDYARSHNGIPQVDAANDQRLRASSIVVMYTHNWFIGRDDQQDMTQEGTGEALFLINGKLRPGTWTRESLAAPTQFWDDRGEEVALNQGGTTWIQVVPLDTPVRVQ